ncbi:MAG TPA: polysaccharide deacetylase family protein [Nitrospira sp.]|nr:polysaccharide deacetylase family protein [Nitrospira sp.]
MPLRMLAKTGVASALHYSGLSAASRAWSRGDVFVVGYHTVVEEVREYESRAIPANLIGLRMLERQLDWLGSRYRFLSLDELAVQAGDRPSGGKPPAVVTFDDGYVGVYEHALPLLKKKGIPAGVFVVTEAVGRPDLQVYDRLYLLLVRALPMLEHKADRLNALFAQHDVRLSVKETGTPLDAVSLMRRLFTTSTQKRLRRAIRALEQVANIDETHFAHLRSMTWDMIAELDRAGWTIGSHTQTHALLTLEQERRVLNQVLGSARTLQRMLGKPIRHFAYPDGRFNPGVVDAVAEAGYRFGYTTCSHRDPRHPWLTIPRTLLWERAAVDAWGRFSPSLMSYAASPIFRYLSPCRQDHGPVPAHGCRPERAAASRRWAAAVERHEC